MSATRPSPTTPGAFLCPRCGGALHQDQDWCLECGLAARTRIHPPPSWRLPIVATLLVALLLAAGIALGLAAIFDKKHPAPAAATVTAPASTTPTATTPNTITTPTVPTATTGASTVPGAGTATTPTTVTPATVVPSTRTSGATTPRATTPQHVVTVNGKRVTVPATTTP